MLQKKNNRGFPKIEMACVSRSRYTKHPFYRKVIRSLLRQILPPHITYRKPQTKAEWSGVREAFQTLVPVIYHLPCDTAPANISLVGLFKYQSNAAKFFFEMISRWLVPGKKLSILSMHAADFRLPEFSDAVMTTCEVLIHVETLKELEELMENIPMIESELRLGITSPYYARRILEIKGLTNDEKTVMIQEHIAALIDRLPHWLEHDIFTEMQHVLVTCRDDFKAARKSRHLSRMISLIYLFRKALKQAVKEKPQKRSVQFKVFRAALHSSTEEEKRVLAVTVGFNFLRDKEVFEERHLLQAIQSHIPLARSVEGSCFVHRRGQENIYILYLEVEKEGGDSFSNQEIALLKQVLPGELEDRIEHLMHPVFNPRNEEEIMRNILSLSNQIKYVRDIPQVFITFDEQSLNEVFFNIILVRVMRKGCIPIQDMFRKADSFLGYIHDRCRVVGHFRKKYAKEATVFRVSLPKEQFLRRDHSVDLYKARQTVVNELARVVGDIRDFNGGMISKQNELLTKLQELLSQSTSYNELLLENFFYSLDPVIMRSVLDPEPLKTLFSMLLDAIGAEFFDDAGYPLKILSDSQFTYAMVPTGDQRLGAEISQRLNAFNTNATLASTCVKVYDTHYWGFIFRCDHPEIQTEFANEVRSAVESWNGVVA